MRLTGHMRAERYLANTSPSKPEVHDLDNEQTRCQINEIIAAGLTAPTTRSPRLAPPPRQLCPLPRAST